jgi:hypothetical protein
MNKIGTAFGCLLLIGAFAAPVAFAHYDTGAHPVPYASAGQDTYGANDAGSGAPSVAAGGDLDRPAGWYVVSTNTYTELDSAFNQPNPLAGQTALCNNMPDLDDPANGNADEVAACVADFTNPINPSFFAAQWSALYDVEVGGPGNCADPADETRVDGAASGSAATATGGVPDGIWNDGGQGGVGHTFGHYACASYETSGCDRYNQALAEDAVGGEDVWIGAVCSWGVPVSGGNAPTLPQVINQFVGDVINCPLGGFPDSCLDAVNYLDDCGLGDFLPTLLPGNNVPNCGGGVPSVVCGAGNISDVDFGRGQGANGPYAVDPGTGVPATWPGVNSNSATYPDAGTSTLGVNCDSVATASAFPFTAVVVTQNAGGAIGVGHVSAATYGWIG